MSPKFSRTCGCGNHIELLLPLSLEGENKFGVWVRCGGCRRRTFAAAEGIGARPDLRSCPFYKPSIERSPQVKA